MTWKQYHDSHQTNPDSTLSNNPAKFQETMPILWRVLLLLVDEFACRYDPAALPHSYLQHLWMSLSANLFLIDPEAFRYHTRYCNSGTSYLLYSSCCATKYPIYMDLHAHELIHETKKPIVVSCSMEMAKSLYVPHSMMCLLSTYT